MLDVAIIGAGELGGTIAHLVARADIASSIRLIDDSGQVAAGKALDIMQAGPIEGFATRVSGSHDIFGCASASVLVIADRAGRTGPSEWSGDEGLEQLARINQIAPGRIIVCAGATQRELVERGVDAGIERARLVGSAPEALVSALRAIVALETNGSSADVNLTVLGVPPGHTIVPWDQATVGGVSLVRLLDEPACRRLAARVAPLWPPGPYALAAAAREAVACIAGQSRRTLSCFVAPDQSGVRQARAVAIPAQLSGAGLVSAAAPPLSGHDQVAFDNAALL